MNIERAKVIVRGAVQGVGFRPFVYRLATDLKLNGWVLNSSQGVFIEVEGARPVVDQFLLRLDKERPPRAVIQSLESSILDPIGYNHFEIRVSEESGAKTVLILPDIATCADCLREMLDPTNRRYLYPFTNCTNCGQRFTIIESLPYDRPNTSMKKFKMCPKCNHEYHDPRDRRFDAQPNACPKCGPHLELWNPAGNALSQHHEALLQAAAAVRSGQILALKGLGGFQLIVDARNEDAVRRLRERKHREEKPLALMYPSLDAVKAQCHVADFEERLLLSAESPIVLLVRRPEAKGLAASVAPWNPNLGVMLPYTPLHHLLMRELGFPIVATSGNLSDEPICTEEHEALERLNDIADVFLVHDRPIVRHVDDSVVRVMLGRELVMRRARGYAPLPIHFSEAMPNILAVGAHLKNAVALSVENEVFISQHIGDLETQKAYSAFCSVTADFQRLYDVTPDLIACDLHPEYLSTKYAQGLPAPLVPVQHHYAHVAACMAENELEGPVLGVSWDGTGYGPDGTIWGGEFLLTDEASFTRVAHFRQFRLPGGEASIKQPRRTALGVLFVAMGEEVFRRADLFPIRDFSESELPLLRQMLEKGVRSPITSSVGRLFDAVASMVGLRQRVNFEGQAAMELEFSLDGVTTDECYPLTIRPHPLVASHRWSAISAADDADDERLSPLAHRPFPFVVDWQPMVLAVLKDVGRGEKIGLISAKFHNTLVEAVVNVADKVGEHQVVLTGGCFQNRYLTERTVRRLQEEGFRPYWHQRVPPNDGGIALGQVFATVRAKQQQPMIEELCIA